MQLLTTEVCGLHTGRGKEEEEEEMEEKEEEEEMDTRPGVASIRRTQEARRAYNRMGGGFRRGAVGRIQTVCI